MPQIPTLKPDKLDRAAAKAAKTTLKIALAPFALVAAILTARAVTKTITRWVHEED
jgi:hypothetical protein